MSGRVTRGLLRLAGHWLALLLLLGGAGPTLAAPPECPAAAHPDPSATLIRATFMASGSEASFSTDKGQEVTLTFPAPALPPDAAVIAAELWLRVSEPRGNPNFTLQVENSGQLFGTRYLSRLQVGQAVIWRANDSAVKALTLGGDMRLKLKAPELNADVRTPMWHGPTAAEAALRPRLIVAYKVPGPQPQQAVGIPGAVSTAPFGVDLNSFALSGQLDAIIERSKGAGIVAYPLAGQGAVFSQTPALGDGLVYIIAKDSRNNSTTLEARSALTGTAIWSAPVQDPSPYVLADSLGRLYVVGNNAVHRFRINPNNTSAPAREDVAFDGLQPTQAPALGPDGSLYVINQGSSLMALDPNFRQLWSIPLGGQRISAITVGPTGCSAYLVSALTNESAPKGLLAIDTATGDKVEAPLPNQADVQSFDKPALDAPVVLLHSDGTEKVYVAADSGTDGSLELFDRTPEEFTLQRRWEKPGLWGQPLARRTQSGWQIIALRAEKGRSAGEQIMSIEWIEGTEANWPISGNGIDRTQMAASSVPTIDDAGTFYSPVRLSSAYAENQRLGALLAFLASTSDPERFLAVRNETGTAIEGPERLMIGPDGALYGLFQASRTPYKLLPQVVLNEGAGAKVCVKSPLFITGQGSSANITAGQGVILGPETRLNGETRISAGSC
jgi:outer membrane protein assembly factor BamB